MLIKHFLAAALCLLSTSFCKAQHTDSIYAFMDNSLPELESSKSSWGIFFLNKPYIIDSGIAIKIRQRRWEGSATAIQDELYTKCLALNMGLQKKFRWRQDKMHKQIIVDNIKQKISSSAIAPLIATKQHNVNAKYWMNEWNRTKISMRLINYSSIPVFSSDGNYVLIVRGQSAGSEGGWDTIYIYHKEKTKWNVWKKIVIAAI